MTSIVRVKQLLAEQLLAKQLLAKQLLARAVVVAQLVERSLPTPEIRRFESRHWQNFIHQFIYQMHNSKDENKEKEAGTGPSLKQGY